MYSIAGFVIIAACAIAWFNWFIDESEFELLELLELELEPLPPPDPDPEPELPPKSICCWVMAAWMAARLARSSCCRPASWLLSWELVEDLFEDLFEELKEL